MFLANYFSIFVFFVASVLLASIIFFLSFFLSSKLDDAEKLTAYECGFNPFSDSRVEFDVKFYIRAQNNDAMALLPERAEYEFYTFSVPRKVEN